MLAHLAQSVTTLVHVHPPDPARRQDLRADRSRHGHHHRRPDLLDGDRLFAHRDQHRQRHDGQQRQFPRRVRQRQPDRHRSAVRPVRLRFDGKSLPSIGPIRRWPRSCCPAPCWVRSRRSPRASSPPNCGASLSFSPIRSANFTPRPARRAWATGAARFRSQIPSWTMTGAVVTVAGDNRVFTIGDLGEPRDGESTIWWTAGTLTWTSGANDGRSMEVGSVGCPDPHHRPVHADAEPHRPPPDIPLGDTFRITPGCDKNRSKCQTRYNNVINIRATRDKSRQCRAAAGASGGWRDRVGRRQSLPPALPPPVTAVAAVTAGAANERDPRGGGPRRHDCSVDRHAAGCIRDATITASTASGSSVVLCRRFGLSDYDITGYSRRPDTAAFLAHLRAGGGVPIPINAAVGWRRDGVSYRPVSLPRWASWRIGWRAEHHPFAPGEAGCARKPLAHDFPQRRVAAFVSGVV